MADPGEFNPKKTTAPGSDNSEGRGGAASFDPTPDWDKNILEEFNKQQEIQEKQTKALKELSERLITNNEALQSARKKQYEAEQKNDQEALELAKKEIFVQEQFQSENLQNLDRLEREMLKQQENIDAAIDLLGESVGKNDIYVKRHLKIEEDAKQIFKKGMEEVAQKEVATEKTFKQFVEDFNTQHLAELEFEEKQNKLLGDKIAAAAAIPEISGTEDEKISAMMQRTSLNLESLATINEKIADEMTAEGIDKEDKAAVERFKMERMMDTKFNESIIKELIKSRDSIKKETVQKELQEKYIRQGIPAAIAAVRAEKNAEAETKKRRAEAAEQIRIFKKMDETQRYQTTLVEADYRHRLEKEKEADGIPEWYLRLEKSLSPINAALEDLRDAYSKSGLFMKVLMVLALLGGIIVGAIVTAVKKVIDIFRAGGIIAEWFAGIRNSVPMIDKMARAIGRMFTWMTEGNAIGRFFVSIFSKVVSAVTYVVNAFKQFGTGLRVLEAAGKEGGIVMRFLAAAARPLVNLMKAFQFGFSMGAGAVNLITKAFSFLGPILGVVGKVVGKLFLPLTILLTAIDGIIGAFKGFKKDGIKGLVLGFFANILSGLTFGLVKFETIYNFFNNTIEKVVEGFKFIFNKTIGLVVDASHMIFDGIKGFFGGIWKGIKWVWDKTMGFVMDAAKMYYKGVTAFYGAVWSGIKWVWDKTIGFVMDAAKTYYKGVTAFYGAVWSGIKWVWNKTMGFAMDAAKMWWNGVTGFFGAIGGGIKWAFNKVTKFYATAGNMIFDAAKSIFSTILETLSSMPKAIADAAANLYSATLDSITGIFSSVWDGMKGIGSWFGSWFGSDEPETPAKAISKNLSPNVGTELARTQQERDTVAAATSKTSGTVITNNTNVNNGGGGGKTPQPTIIAPQPPRNTEPTLRAMQFGEQPAF